MWSLNPIESLPTIFPPGHQPLPPIAPTIPTVPNPDPIVTTAPTTRDERDEARRVQDRYEHIDLHA